MKPYISIIIPSYNRLNFVFEAIDSALNQDIKDLPKQLSEYEIIVVFDGGFEVFKKLIKSKYSKVSKVKFIDKENGGVSSALNAGIKAAQGKFVNWLSDDDLLEPNHLKAMLNKLMAVEWCVRMNPTIIYGGWKIVDEKNNIMSEGENQLQSIPSELQDNTFYPLIKSRIHGCSLLVEKKFFRDYGYFDEKQKTTGDYHRWFSFLLKGNIFLTYYTENTVRSRFHKNQDSHSLNKVHIDECDKLWTYFAENFASIPEKEKFTAWNYLTLMQNHIKDSSYKAAYKNLQTIVKLNTPTVLFLVSDPLDLEVAILHIKKTYAFTLLLNWAIYLKKNESSYEFVDSNIPNETRINTEGKSHDSLTSAFFSEYPIYGSQGLVRVYDIRICRLSDSLLDDLINLEKNGPWQLPMG